MQVMALEIGHVVERAGEVTAGSAVEGGSELVAGVIDDDLLTGVLVIEKASGLTAESLAALAAAMHCRLQQVAHQVLVAP